MLSKQAGPHTSYLLAILFIYWCESVRAFTVASQTAQHSQMATLALVSSSSLTSSVEAARQILGGRPAQFPTRKGSFAVRAVSNPPVKMGEAGVVKAKDLKIVWGNDNRYWRLPSNEQPDEPAELLQVCWLEVTGSYEVDRKKKCQVSFEVSLTPGASGWRNTALYIMAKRGVDGKYVWRQVDLTNRSNNDGVFLIPDQVLEVNPLAPPEPGSADKMVYFGLYEIWTDNWKSGLKIYQANVKEI